jgi:hypothetical protein
MAGFLQPSCSHYPFVVRRIYTIALYLYYPITLYHIYFIVSILDHGFFGNRRQTLKVGQSRNQSSGVDKKPPIPATEGHFDHPAELLISVGSISTGD